MDTHRFNVREISKHITSFHSAQHPFRISHAEGSSFSTRPMPPHIRGIVDISPLNHILTINIEHNYAMVEPSVTFYELCTATLKRGLMPLIVPPFPSMTIGGAFSGTATSSASWKYGFFEESVGWIEVVLPDGKITTASPRRHEELFEGMKGSLGTLGVVTFLQVKLVPAAKFVEVTYTRVGRAHEGLDRVDDACRTIDTDFVEGVVFGAEDEETLGVVVTGSLAAFKTAKVRRFGRSWDPWFWEHARSVVKGGGNGEVVECVPIMDYLFRHDRGFMAMGRFAFGRVPENRFTRCLADYGTRSRNLAQSVRKLHWAEHVLIQDVAVPMEKSLDMLNWLEDCLGVYPLHFCPVRQWPEKAVIMRPNPTKTEMLLGISIRGYTPDTLHDTAKFKEKNRELERVVGELGGRKWLYGRNYYSEKEFWEVYPRGEYEGLRVKYNAQCLGSVFDKTRTVLAKRKGPVKVEGFWNNVLARTSVLAVGGKEKFGSDAVGK